MAEAAFRTNSTGPIGVYLVKATSPANRMTGSSATYYPLGTCEKFPKMDEENLLQPVVNDLGGDAPFTNLHGGMMGSGSMVLNRFSWTNLLKFINSDFTDTLETEASAGTIELGKAGLLTTRGDGVDDNHAFGLYFHYGFANLSNSSGRLPALKVGRRYHSISLQKLQLLSMGSRQFATQIDWVAGQELNASNNPEIFRDLTSTPGSLTITDFACQDLTTTGSVGIYGSIDAGANYLPIGHCERFPIVTFERTLTPVYSDLFGDAPHTYTFGGEKSTVEMDLGRFKEANLDTVLNATYTSAAGSITQTKIGTSTSINGSAIKLWFPSSLRPTTAASLIMNYGHFRRATNTQAGSRQFKRGIIWESSGKFDCSGLTGNLARWSLAALGSEVIGDFTV